MTGAGNTCDDITPEGCIFTKNLIVFDATPEEVSRQRSSHSGVTSRRFLLTFPSLALRSSPPLQERPLLLPLPSRLLLLLRSLSRMLPRSLSAPQPLPSPVRLYFPFVQLKIDSEC